jgi:hypothetical protein
MTPTPDGLDAGGAQGLARGCNRVRTLLLLAGGVVLGTACYWFRVRPWMAQWGTSQEERTRQMPGDRIIGHPTNSAMQAVTVEARPEDIWPWLVQIGYQRGGLYSYDWLDRIFGFLDRPSSTDILPQFQNLAVGDRILWMKPSRFVPRQELTVAVLEPAQSLALRYDGMGMEWVWQFGLYPLDATRTRFVTRGIERVPDSVAGRLGMLIMEPASFIMTRRMLLGVKRRAEALRASQARLRHVA